MEDFKDIRNLEDLKEKAEEMLNDPQKRLEFAKALVKHCYENLNEEQKVVFEEMIRAFPDINDGDIASGLSIIFMNYPSYGKINTYDEIITEHARLFEEWSPNDVEKWVAHRMAKCDVIN